MNWLDIVFLIVLAASVVAGFRQGMARVLIGLVAAILGVLFGFWFYGYAGAVLEPYVRSRTAANLLGFLIIYVLCTVGGALLGVLCAKLFKWVGLSWADRLAGGLAGGLKGAFLCVLVVVVAMAFPLPHLRRSLGESRIAPKLAVAAETVCAMAPREIHDAFTSAYDEARALWNDALKMREHRARQKRGGSRLPTEKL